MNSIVVPEHFIQASRDTGYRSLAFAVAELIDNAIDAGASQASIRVAEERRGGEREITISVCDNGSGMDRSTLWESLRFGGSEHFNGRSSLGRYGMGLPNSSVSQASRVDVYTWQNWRRPLHAYLDVDEIAAKLSSGVREPVATQLPRWFKGCSASGTLVVWSRCDRLRFKKASTLVRKIDPVLGQMFRVPLARSLELQINGGSVALRDPLFRTPVEALPGTSEPYGDPIEYRVKSTAGETSVVTIQFVELPVARWHDLPMETKRSAGIIGRAGMSVLRGGREIDHGWYLFGKKRRENYDDWWRAELSFEPALDELFGITHSKQGINPAPEIREILEADLEKVARSLNRRARSAFIHARSIGDSERLQRVSKRDRLLPSVQVQDAGRHRATGDGFRFQIRLHDEAIPEFFEVSIDGSLLTLEINKNHLFYQRLYSRGSDQTTGVDLLLISAARALLDLSDDARQRLLRNWSDNLLAYLAG